MSLFVLDTQWVQVATKDQLKTLNVLCRNPIVFRNCKNRLSVWRQQVLNYVKRHNHSHLSYYRILLAVNLIREHKYHFSERNWLLAFHERLQPLRWRLVFDQYLQLARNWEAAWNPDPDRFWIQSDCCHIAMHTFKNIYIFISLDKHKFDDCTGRDIYSFPLMDWCLEQLCSVLPIMLIDLPQVLVDLIVAFLNSQD